MNIGKHSEEAIKIRNLEDIVKRKDREIKDIKVECEKKKKKIRDLCFSNTYNERFDKLKKIHEIASENFSIFIL